MDDGLWFRTELDTLGFSYEHAQAIKSKEPTFAKLLIDTNMVLDELTTIRPTFREQDLYLNLARQAQLTGDNATNINCLAEQSIASSQVIQLGNDFKGNQLYTTLAVIQSEKKMVKLAKLLSSSTHSAPSEEIIKQAILAKQSQCGYSLSEEQAEAICTACTSQQLAILQGSAGAGKSVSMEVLRSAYKAMGCRVLGACIAKVAANNLEKETGIRSMTIAMLIKEIDLGKRTLTDTGVLVIDEAGQVGARQMLILLEAAKATNTKIVLVGEDKQIDAIERGGVLKYLSRPDIVGTSRIETIRRQNTKSARKVVMDLRDGNSKAALDSLNKSKLVNFSSSHESAIQQLVNKWKNYTEHHPEKPAVVLAQRWKEVESISKQLREVNQKRGLVGYENIELKCVVSNKPMTQLFSVGERVRFAKNDYKIKVSNGSLGTVLGIERVQEKTRLHIKLDNGLEVSIDPEIYQNEDGLLPLVHAYAMTVYSSQGVTVDGDTFVLYNSNMGRASTYVAGSRHRDNCHFFVNQKDIDFLVSPTRDNVSQENRLSKLAERMRREQCSSLAIERLTEEQLVEFDIGQPLAEIKPLSYEKEQIMGELLVCDNALA
jgi:ATP-dependent exoDNAse (exonuclease V) alpha subunit